MTTTPTQAPRFVVTIAPATFNIYAPDATGLGLPIIADSLADALEFMAAHALPGEVARIVKHDGTIDTVQL